VRSHRLDLLRSQSQDSTPSSSKVLVGLVVLVGNNGVHLLEGLRSSLDGNDGGLLLSSGFRDDRDGGHPLESGRELVSTLDVDLGLVKSLDVILGGDDVAWRKEG